MRTTKVRAQTLLVLGSRNGHRGRHLRVLALLIGAGALPTALCRDAQAGKSRRPKPSVTCPPVPSTDVDAPTPLASKTVSGCRPGKRVSYYYKFAADAGPITLSATGSNRPSGFANALQVIILNSKSEELCSVSLGNATRRTTNTATCKNVATQSLLLRINLDPDSNDYSVTLGGPITLGRSGGTPVAAGPAAADAGDAAASTNIDAPTPFVGPTIRGTGTNQASSYYYSLSVGPGDVTLTADGKNRPAASASALGLTLQDSRARPLCTVSIGNTTRDARKVATCAIPTQQQAILRVDLAPETIDWRAKVEGAVSTP
ncbi:MAG: hypothetical protein ACJ8F1_05865 [Polyangia bacterium]